MGEAVDDPQDATQFADLPDLTELLLQDVLISTSPVLARAMRRVVEEADRPETTASFGSFITPT